MTDPSSFHYEAEGSDDSRDQVSITKFGCGAGGWHFESKQTRSKSWLWERILRVKSKSHPASTMKLGVESEEPPSFIVEAGWLL